MSWTVPQVKGDQEENEAIKFGFERVIKEAARQHILMFCAVDDNAEDKDDSLPGSICKEYVIRIGSADRQGVACKWTNRADADFILPGSKVKEDFSDSPCNRLLTGSSVATALATGLAGVVLHCARLSAMLAHKDPEKKGVLLETKNYVDMRSREKMAKAFKSIGTGSGERSDTKFIKTWEGFESTAERLRNSNRLSTEEKWTELAHIARNLMKVT
jgi:hypothetical protein